MFAQVRVEAIHEAPFQDKQIKTAARVSPVGANCR
jgi:hypothetical protein